MWFLVQHKIVTFPFASCKSAHVQQTKTFVSKSHFYILPMFVDINMYSPVYGFWRQPWNIHLNAEKFNSWCLQNCKSQEFCILTFIFWALFQLPLSQSLHLKSCRHPTHNNLIQFVLWVFWQGAAHRTPALLV